MEPTDIIGLIPFYKWVVDIRFTFHFHLFVNFISNHSYLKWKKNHKSMRKIRKKKKIVWLMFQHEKKTSKWRPRPFHGAFGWGIAQIFAAQAYSNFIAFARSVIGDFCLSASVTFQNRISIILQSLKPTTTTMNSLLLINCYNQNFGFSIHKF